MEQLAQLPVWIQLLSMGSFLFASGFLMTRCPLLPTLLLSFFYAYGVLGNGEMPSFCVKHPWVWSILLLLPLIVLGILWWSLLGASSGPDGGMGIGMAMAWLTIISIAVLAVIFLVTWVPAFIKTARLLIAVHQTPWQTLLLGAFFIVGIIAGLVGINFTGLFSDPLLFFAKMLPLLIRNIPVALLICTLSLLSIKSKSMGGGFALGIAVCLILSILQSLCWTLRYEHLAKKHTLETTGQTYNHK